MTEKDEIRASLEEALASGRGPAVARFALACLGGVPLAGGVAGAAAGTWSEREQRRINDLFAAWLKLQQEEIEEIGRTLMEVAIRVDPSDPDVAQRMSSRGYLSLVKKAFRDWSAAESEDKRVLIRNLLANAASCQMSSDDVVSLFVEWVGRYSELHFKVIACVYRHPQITRAGIWREIDGTDVRDDSPEADLFKLITHDLTVGYVMRQHRDVDAEGRYLKPRPTGRRGSTSRYMQTPFDDTKRYELTNLGRQFVHYTMNELVPKIGPGADA